MRQRFRRNEDWCPECGHLLPKNNWDCDFCGWSGSSSRLGASLAGTGSAGEIEAMAFLDYTDNNEKFINQLQADGSITFPED